jgi:hypothetical protein
MILALCTLELEREFLRDLICTHNPPGDSDSKSPGTLVEPLDWLLNDRLDQKAKVQALQREVEELRHLINTPETEDFDRAVPLEAAHQVERWGVAHDGGKTHPDWFWLVGYLAGKALAASLAGDIGKAKHHCISTSAALRNWHAHLRAGESFMRPGIETPA